MFDCHPLDSTIASFRLYLEGRSGSTGTGELDGSAGDPGRREFPRERYHEVIRAGVEYYAGHQTDVGAIVDPDFSEEWHYSTPAFALASAYLVAVGENELLPAAERALSWGCATLAEGRACQGHSNFYPSMLMRAIDYLRPHVSPQTLERWRSELRKIDPETIYYFGDHQVPRYQVHNWNLLALAGEFRRSRAGFTTSSAFFDRHIGYHLARLTSHGLYVDGSLAPGNIAHPLAYDLVGRAALIDLLSQGWKGDEAILALRALERGAATQLFFQDPNGEYVCTGRSAHHIWNEAALAHLAEWAATHFAAQDPLLAGAFRRQAQLALASMISWYQEPGRFYAVKNRFEPAERQGFEQYTVSTTYNLWALTALAMAAAEADESIAPSEIPAERFAYEVDSGDEFHLLVAASHGHFVAVELAGDPNYEPTGIVRIARRGVPSHLGPSAGSVNEPRFATLAAGGFLAHGPAWRDRLGKLHSLAELMTTPVIARFYRPYLPEVLVDRQEDSLLVRLIWKGGFSGARAIQLEFAITSECVRLSYEVELVVPPVSTEEWVEAHMPILAHDGRCESEISVHERELTVRRGKDRATIAVLEGGVPRVDLDEIGSRIGILNRAVVCGNGRVLLLISLEGGKEM